MTNRVKKRGSPTRALLLSFGFTVLVGCAGQQTRPVTASDGASAPGNVDSLLIVDCLLPGQVRKLGRNFTYLTPRRAVKSAASECEIRGGEYTSYDRANFATALKIWLPAAKGGDPEAQTYVGEIYEKGLGLESDYTLAAFWYGKAADQGFSRAQINLGFLYESGLGVPRDLTQAMNFYRQASGFQDGDLEYVSSVEAANRVVKEQERIDLKDQVAALEIANTELRRKQGQIEQERADLARLTGEIQAQRALVLEAQEAIAAASAAQKASGQADADAMAAAEARSNSDTARLGKALAELDKAGRELESAEVRQKQLRAALEKQKAETNRLQQQVNADNAQTRNKSNELSVSEQEIERLNARIAELEQADQNEATEANELAANRDALEKRLLEERASADQLRQDVARLRASQSDASRLLEQQLAEARQNEAGLNSNLNDGLAQVRSLELQVAQNEEAYAAQLETLRGQLARSQDEQQIANDQLAQQQQRLDQQSEQVASQQELLARQNEQVEAQQKLLQEQSEAASLQGERLATAQAEQRRLSDRVMLGEIDAEQQAKEAAARLATLEAQLNQKQGIIVQQQNDIESLQNNVTKVRASLEDRDIEKINQVVATGPTIEIIEPPVLVSRGKPSLQSLPGNSEMEVIGRIGPLDNLLTFKINGKALNVNDSGVFVHKVRPSDVSSLQMVAVSNAGERTDLEFSVLGTALAQGTPVPREAEINPDNVAFGNYHALIIGNNEYEGFHDLKSAEADALAMDEMLRERYGFETELLINATRYDILSAMNRKREQLTEKDNLLIYYAGHGELSNAKGYWMPVDAEPNSTTNWISNTSITDLVESMSAKHVMVIADSCYSGSLTRSSLARVLPGMSPEKKLKWYNSVAALKVRTVLSSGGVKPVLDSTGNSKHSLFAQALLDELGSADGIVEAYQLFLKVQKRVKQGARQFNLDQNPQYSPIKHAGHESGEFLFVAREGSARAPSSSAPLKVVAKAGDDSAS